MGATFALLKKFILACKSITQSNYVNRTEIKQKHRPMTCVTDQVVQHFGIEIMVFCMLFVSC